MAVAVITVPIICGQCDVVIGEITGRPPIPQQVVNDLMNSHECEEK